MFLQLKKIIVPQLFSIGHGYIVKSSVETRHNNMFNHCLILGYG